MHTNHLIQETSPYLLQHAHNPVDWYPWGKEALGMAKKEDKPILVSIGYSSCHWCHVMERECFENEAIARIQNQHFINIKIDREERPDLDEIYMHAVQLLTGRGGWPLNVFLSPDLKPFFGGTYFPPQARFNMISWPDLLVRVSQYYHTQKEDLKKAQEQLFAYLQNLSDSGESAADLTDEPVSLCIGQLKQSYDKTYGGFGPPPKFPHPMDIQLLLRYAHRMQDDSARNMAVHTLDKMARGGMYDQLGGGFHRYSTDEKWLIPHFEKMLYDNALLLKSYADAFILTRRTDFQRVCEGIVAYVAREMTHPQGAFFAAQDADAEGKEGDFFVWSLDEIERILGQDKAMVVAAYFGMSRDGNFEGKNILSIPDKARESIRQLNPAAEDIVSAAIPELLAARKLRAAPQTDTKIIASWNGLMIGALAKAGFHLNRPDWIEMACKAKDFILAKMWTDDGLQRIHKDNRTKISGFLEDYAFLAEGFLDLFEATGEPAILQSAVDLMELTERYFSDPVGGGYFFTKESQQDVITRSRSCQDGATPSAQSVAVMNLLRLGFILAQDKYLERAQRILKTHYGLMMQMPRALVNMVINLDFFLQETREIILAAKTSDAKAEAFLKILRERYSPYKTLVLLKEEHQEAWRRMGLFQQQRDAKETTLFVCHGHFCDEPIRDPGDPSFYASV